MRLTRDDVAGEGAGHGTSGRPSRPDRGVLPGEGAGPERGAVSVEVALVVPALLLLAALTAASWRIHQVRGDVQSAAEVAARAVSVAAGPAAGTATGTRVARAELAGTGCASPQVWIDPGGLSAPVGSPGVVNARIGCTVTMSDLLVPGLPGSFHVSAQAGAPVDSHRERGS